MNKQQLANKIWATAQKMRSSKIEAQQYKDYLLGFIFYKFLSANEVNFLIKEGMTEEQLNDPICTSTEMSYLRKKPLISARIVLVTSSIPSISTPHGLPKVLHSL